MATNTPLITIERLRTLALKADDITGISGTPSVPVQTHILRWLLDDAERLNRLEMAAIERGFEGVDGAIAYDKLSGDEAALIVGALECLAAIDGDNGYADSAAHCEALIERLRAGPQLSGATAAPTEPERNPRVVDNDNGEITVFLDGKELRGWSYTTDAASSDRMRRHKMDLAREYVEGWCGGRDAT